MSTVVRDARPPAVAIRLLNPILRILLRSPLGRLVKPFALIEFLGRRSGRRYRVPVGMYRANDVMVAFTPAAWRGNFDGGAAVKVHSQGRERHLIGTLITDPTEVAASLRSVLAGGTSPKLLGLEMPADHHLNASDVASIGRAMIQFHTHDSRS